jgi:hypothetical protein
VSTHTLLTLDLNKHITNEKHVKQPKDGLLLEISLAARPICLSLIFVQSRAYPVISYL